MSLIHQTLAEVADEVRGAAPAPGGGRGAALSGCLAASLVAMVCRLTAGKPAYAAHETEVLAVMKAADELEARLLAGVDEDTDAYLDVVAAYRLPKGTPEEAAARRLQIQAAIRRAAEVPLATAVACLEVLELAARVIGGFNSSAASDLGVAVQMAAAGVRGAALNVAINVPSLDDAEASAALRRRATETEVRADVLVRELWPTVRVLVEGEGT
ncbi:MAG TPA: cyclodeaminase/cyclohydrolase family protein [Thermoleophilia bacterium]|nr:cyclodeaminase/cyclohydrolase family protein [Thermoleophilia bacterium]